VTLPRPPALALPALTTTTTTSSSADALPAASVAAPAPVAEARNPFLPSDEHARASGAPAAANAAGLGATARSGASRLSVSSSGRIMPDAVCCQLGADGTTVCREGDGSGRGVAGRDRRIRASR